MKPKVIHVATTGDDRAAGTESAPLATPHGALAALRRLRRGGQRRTPVTVCFHAGVYHLPRPLVFKAEDSGTPQSPVVFAAHPGDKVVISAGQPIRTWRETSVKGRRCWEADLPEIAAGKWTSTQLFVGEQRRPRARLPKKGWYRFADYVKPEERCNKWYEGPPRMHFRPGDLKPWKNLDDVRLVTPEYWFLSHHRIKRIDTKRSIVHFKANSVASLHDESAQCGRYFVENVLAALEEPGEWTLDRSTGKLRYLPLDHETLDNTTVVIARHEAALRLAGTAQRPVAHIRFENLSFRHAEFDYADDYPGDVQAAVSVPGTVVLQGARDCVLYGCEVSQGATYGIEVLEGCHNNRIVACALHDLGGGGVRIGHEWMARVDETSLRIIPKKASPLPSATLVSDCRIHDVGKIFLNAIGIFVGNAGRNRVVHNEVFDVNYTGISCGWTWQYDATATYDNLIAYNHVHHVNWRELLSDNAGIYTLGIQPGTVVRGNHVHHVGAFRYGAVGIYTDESSSEIRVEDNLVHHTLNAGYFTHCGRDIVVRNNIFAMAKAQHIRAGNRDPHRVNVLERNLVYWEQGALDVSIGWGLQSCEWGLEHFRFARNLFFSAAGEVDFRDGRTLASLQAAGQHLETVIADPLFADPQGGDFSLRADSPAHALGFKPLDLSKVGPRRADNRPLSYADWPEDVFPERQLIRIHMREIDRTRVELRVENVGHIPASGTIRLTPWPTADLRLTGRRTIRFRDLAPGATQSAEIGIMIAEDAGLVTLEATPSGKDMVPAMLHLNRPNPASSQPRS